MPEGDQRRADVFGRRRVGVGGQGDDAGDDQPHRAEDGEQAAGRQQQLGEQQGDADQRDDDEGVHAAIIRFRSLPRARSAGCRRADPRPLE